MIQARATDRERLLRRALPWRRPARAYGMSQNGAIRSHRLPRKGERISLLKSVRSGLARRTQAHFNPQFVLLDIGMPGMDGYEVARRLQSMSLTPAPVLIALTGYGQASDRKRSAEAGFSHHAVKPVDPQKLLIDVLQVRPA